MGLGILLCSRVLELTKTHVRWTRDDAVEIFLRDRKRTVRRIASDRRGPTRKGSGGVTAWASGRGLQYVDEVDADIVDSIFGYVREGRMRLRTGEPLSGNSIRDNFLSSRAFFNARHKRRTAPSLPGVNLRILRTRSFRFGV